MPNLRRGFRAASQPRSLRINGQIHYHVRFCSTIGSLAIVSELAEPGDRLEFLAGDPVKYALVPGSRSETLGRHYRIAGPRSGTTGGVCRQPRKRPDNRRSSGSLIADRPRPRTSLQGNGFLVVQDRMVQLGLPDAGQMRGFVQMPPDKCSRRSPPIVIVSCS